MAKKENPRGRRYRLEPGLARSAFGDDYTVLEAVDGEQGVKAAEQEPPDLILMDLGMPVMDGWEATRRLKANDALKHIPIIAVTFPCHGRLTRSMRARQAADDYLPKAD